MTAPGDSYLAADAEDRRAALSAAVQLAADGSLTWPGHGSPAWLDAADRAYTWLRQRDSLKPAAVTIVPGQPHKEGTIPVTTTFDLSDTDEVTFTLSAQDAKGSSVPMPADTWQWALADPDGTGSTLTVSADTLSATVAAGTPDTTGTLTLTVTGQSSGLNGAEAILVQASAAATIGLVAGTPVAEAPPATPPATA